MDAWLGDGDSDGDFAADDLVAGIFSWLLAIVLGLLIAFFLPFVLLAVEAVLVVIGVALFFRPWRVTAETRGPAAERLEWRVKGWRRSKRAVAEVARELASGVEAAPAEHE